MKWKSHPFVYDSRDFTDIYNFLSERYRLTNDIYGWGVPRLETWKYHVNVKKSNTDITFFEKNCRIWRNDDESVAAVFICEDGDNDVHVLTHPDHEGLDKEVYDWVEKFWAGEKKFLMTFVPSYDTSRQAVLKELNYTLLNANAGFSYKFEMADIDTEYSLEKGFTVQSIDIDGNYNEAAKLYGEVFNNSGFDLEVYNTTRKAPGYNVKLDLGVLDKEGKRVAFCFGWIDRAGKIAEIEPLGTHSHYRRRGFASAVIKECFKRLKAMGIKYVYIGGNSPLYNTLSPIEKIAFQAWIKDRGTRE